MTNKAPGNHDEHALKPAPDQGVINNTEYYKSNDGGAIMNSKNFSAEIDFYLNSELAICASLIINNRYEYMAELGCGSLRMLGVSRASGARYLGIDMRKELINSNKYFISNNNIELCRFVSAKAHRFFKLSNVIINDKFSKKLIKNGLIILPFNLIGNLDNIIEFMGSLTRRRQGILISQFSTHERASLVRLNYYKSCGLQPEYEYNSLGCLFRCNNGFSSYSYNSDYLNNLMREHGYYLESNFASKIYNISHYMSSPNK